MSAAAAAVEQESEVAPQAPEPPVVRADATCFGRWSAFIDLGDGAEDCPEHGVECSDPAHFHAWLRIPNGLQHREIRERGLAAQARRKRLLSNPDSDAGVVLEGEVEELRIGADKEPVVDALLARDRMADLQRASAEVQGQDEFERIGYDRERYEHLEAMPESERPADEFTELRRHITEYETAIKEAFLNLQNPKREALGARELEDLLNEYRIHRVEQEGLGEYLHVYALWEVIACTFAPYPNPTTGRPSVRQFRDEESLRAIDGHVLDAISAKLDELRSNQQRAVMGGNS